MPNDAEPDQSGTGIDADYLDWYKNRFEVVNGYSSLGLDTSSIMAKMEAITGKFDSSDMTELIEQRQAVDEDFKAFEAGAVRDMIKEKLLGAKTQLSQRMQAGTLPDGARDYFIQISSQTKKRDYLGALGKLNDLFKLLEGDAGDQEEQVPGPSEDTAPLAEPQRPALPSAPKPPSPPPSSNLGQQIKEASVKMKSLMKNAQERGMDIRDVRSKLVLIAELRKSGDLAGMLSVLQDGCEILEARITAVQEEPAAAEPEVAEEPETAAEPEVHEEPEAAEPEVQPEIAEEPEAAAEPEVHAEPEAAEPEAQPEEEPIPVEPELPTPPGLSPPPLPSPPPQLPDVSEEEALQEPELPQGADAQELMEELESLDMDIQSLKRIDMDTALLENDLFSISSSIDRGQLIGLEHTIESLHTTLDEIFGTEVKEIARELIVEIKGMIGGLRGQGLPADGEMALFKEIAIHIKEGSREDFILGIQKARELRAGIINALGKHQRSGYEASLKELEVLFNEFLGLDLDPTLFHQELEEMKMDYSQGEKEKAMEKLAHLKISVQDSIAERYRELVDERKEILSNALDRAKEMELDVDSAVQVLAMLEPAMDRRSYEESVRILNENIDLVEEAITEGIGRQKGKLVDIISALDADLTSFEERTGEEQSKLRSLLLNASQALDVSDFPNAEEHIEMFQRFRAELESSFALEESQGALDHIREQTGRLLNLGIMNDVLKELTAHCQDQLSSGDNEAVRDALQRTREELDRTLSTKAKELALSNARRSKEMFASLKEKGQDVTEEKDLFKNILMKVKEGDYLTASEGTVEIIARFGAKEEEYERSELSKMLKEAEATFEDLSDKELDVSEARDLALKAKEGLDSSEDLASIREMLCQSLDICSGVRDQHEAETALAKIDEVGRFMDNNSELGIDTVQMREKLASARVLIEEGKLDEGTKLIRGAEDGFRDKRAVIMRARITELLAQADILFINAQQMGLDVSSERSTFDNAKLVLTAEKYSESLGLVNAVVQSLNAKITHQKAVSVISEFLSEKDDIKAEIDEMKELGLDMSAARGQFHLALKNAEEQDIRNFKQYRKRMVELVGVAKALQAKELSNQRTKDTAKLFKEVMAQGNDLSSNKEQLVMINDANKNEDYVLALKINRDLSSHLTQLQEPFILRVQKLIEETRGFITETVEVGLDITALANIMEDAQEFYNEGLYSRAERKLREAKEIAINAKKNFTRNRTDEVLDEVRALQDECSQKGIQINKWKVSTFIGKVSTLLKRRRYYNALSVAEEAKAYVADELRKHRRTGLEGDIEDISSLLEAGAGKELDITSELESFVMAKQLLQEGDLEGTSETLADLRARLLLFLNGVSEEDYQLDLGNLTTVIQKVKEQGIDVSDVPQNLMDVKVLSGEGRYYEAKLEVNSLADDLNGRMVDKTRSDILKDMSDARTRVKRHIRYIGNAETILENFDFTPLDIEKLQILITSAEDQMTEDQYQLAGESMDEFKSISREQWELLKEKIYPLIAEKYSVKVKVLEDLGLTTALARELIISGQEHIEEGDLDSYIEVQHHIEDILNDAESRIKEIIRQRLVVLKTSFRDLNARGIDLTRAREQFTSVQNAIKERDYMLAAQNMLTTQVTLEEEKGAFQKNFVESTMADAQELMSCISERSQVKEIRRRLYDTKRWYERDRFENAYMLAKELHTHIEQMKISSLKTKAEVDLKNTDAQVKELEASIGPAELEVQDIYNQLTQAKDSFQKQDYQGTMEILKHMAEGLSVLSDKNLKIRVERGLEHCGVLIQEEPEEVAPFDEMVQLLELARSDYQSGNMETAMDNLNAFRMKYIEFKRGGFLNFLEVISVSDQDVTIEGEEIRMLLDTLELTLSEKQYIAAMETTRECSELVEATRLKVTQMREYHQLYKETDLLMTLCRDNGIEVPEEIERDLGMAINHRENNKLDIAIELLRNVTRILGAKYNDQMSETAEERLITLEGKIKLEFGMLDEDTKTGMAETIESLESKTAYARKAFEEGNFRECIAFVDQAQELFASFRDDRSQLEAGELLSKARDQVKRSKDLGMDVFNSEAYLFKANNAYEEGNFDNTLRFAKIAYESALEAEMSAESGMIKEMLKTTELLVAQGEELGLDMDPVDLQLPRVEHLLEERVLQEARALIEDTRALAMDIIGHHQLSRLETRKAEIQSLIDLAGEENIDIEALRAEMGSIAALEEAKNYSDAMAKLDGIEEEISRKISTKNRDQVKDKLDSAFKSYEQFKVESGEAFSDLEEILQRVLDHFTNGEYDITEEQLELFYHMRQTKSLDLAKDRYKEIVDDHEDRMLTFEGLNMDVSVGKELLYRIKGFVNEGEFGKAEDDIHELNKYLDEDLPAQVQVRAQDNLDELNTMMEKLRSSEIVLDRFENDFTDLLTSMDNRKFMVAFIKSTKLKEEIYGILNSAKRERLYSRLKEVEDFYLKVRSKPYFSDKYKEIMKRALEDLQSHYSNAEWAAMEEKFAAMDKVMEELRGRMVDQDKVQEMLRNVEKAIETAENLAADIDDELKVKKTAEKLISEDKGERAMTQLRNILVKVKKKINKRRREISLGVLEEAEYEFTEKRDRMDQSDIHFAQELLLESKQGINEEKFEESIRSSRKLEKFLDGVRLKTEPDRRPEPKKERKGPMRMKIACPSCRKPFAALVETVPAAVACPYCGKRALIKTM